MSARQVSKGFVWVGLSGCLALGLLFAWIQVARADVGPVPFAPPGGGIQTLTDTPVQMAAETVRIAIRLATEADLALFSVQPEDIPYAIEWLPAVADVQADFVLVNPSDEPQALTAWFPLAAGLTETGFQGRISPITVRSGERELEVSVVSLPNPNDASLPDIPWASFPLTFTAGGTTPVQVTYVLPPQMTPGDFISMKFNYIFQSGAGWAGAIGQADLIVTLPYAASAETVGEAPPGVQADGETLTWRWTDLEPTAEDDFEINLIIPERWQAVETARAQADANPQSGAAWLALGKAYRQVIYSKAPRLHKYFGAVYYERGLEAYQNAVELLPDSAEAHAGLAEMRLVPLFTERSASPEELQAVLDELALAEQLEAARPPQAGELPASLVRFFVEIFQEGQVAQATEQAQATSTAAAGLVLTAQAQQTAQAAFASMPLPSPTALPSATPLPVDPLATAEPQPGATSGWPLPLAVGVSLLAGGVLLLGIALWLRSRKS